jgi:hypothetical protein
MAHLTLQLGAAIIVPFGAIGHRRGAKRWQARMLRAAAAADAGLPVLPGRFSRYARIRPMPPVTARAGGPLDGGEA